MHVYSQKNNFKKSRSGTGVVETSDGQIPGK